MKEYPIPFNTEMVRAILDNRKTMTRRVIRQWKGDYSANINLLLEFCPYGQVGDRLWVRETFAKRPLPSGGEQILYKTQYHELVEMLDLDEFIERHGYPKLNISWKPSIHMFRKDSRITLEITGVRVERLQEITYQDTLAEGCLPQSFELAGGKFNKYELGVFMDSWDSLNAKRGYGWDTNCWVWVLTFKKV